MLESNVCTSERFKIFVFEKTYNFIPKIKRWADTFSQWKIYANNAMRFRQSGQITHSGQFHGLRDIRFLSLSTVRASLVNTIESSDNLL